MGSGQSFAALRVKVMLKDDSRASDNNHAQDGT